MFAIIVHFNIQKLKNKQTFIQTEKAKSSHFDRTREDKNQIFPTLIVMQVNVGGLVHITKQPTVGYTPTVGTYCGHCRWFRQTLCVPEATHFRFRF